eukprot:g40965.t1
MVSRTYIPEIHVAQVLEERGAGFVSWCLRQRNLWKVNTIKKAWKLQLVKQMCRQPVDIVLEDGSFTMDVQQASRKDGQQGGKRRGMDREHKQTMCSPVHQLAVTFLPRNWTVLAVTPVTGQYQTAPAYELDSAGLFRALDEQVKPLFCDGSIQHVKEPRQVSPEQQLHRHKLQDLQRLIRLAFPELTHVVTQHRQERRDLSGRATKASTQQHSEGSKGIRRGGANKVQRSEAVLQHKYQASCKAGEGREDGEDERTTVFTVLDCMDHIIEQTLLVRELSIVKDGAPSGKQGRSLLVPDIEAADLLWASEGLQPRHHKAIHWPTTVGTEYPLLLCQQGGEFRQHQLFSIDSAGVTRGRNCATCCPAFQHGLLHIPLELHIAERRADQPAQPPAFQDVPGLAVSTT